MKNVDDIGHGLASMKYVVPEIAHNYGDMVHILSDPYIRTLLVRLCSVNTGQPQINNLVDEIYRGMLAIAIGAEFPRSYVKVPTRMVEHVEEGVFRGVVVGSNVKAVTVALSRAGILPSHACYSQLLKFLNPDNVRQDHFHLQRKYKEGKVDGVKISGAKIGGPIEHAFVFIPDPMGATGVSMRNVIAYYKEKFGNTARCFIAVHLIITPEYLHSLWTEHPDVVVYAARLDRGLSSPEVLQEIPGMLWTSEKGLTDKGYIVPGAGGLGEILNNSFV